MKLPLKLNFHSHYEASKILLHFLLFYLFIYLFLSIPQCPLQIFLLKFSSSSSFYSFFLTRLIIFIIFFVPNGDEGQWYRHEISVINALIYISDKTSMLTEIARTRRNDWEKPIQNGILGEMEQWVICAVLVVGAKKFGQYKTGFKTLCAHHSCTSFLHTI